MLKIATERLHAFLRWSEKYTKTDMVYLASGSFWLIASQVVVTIVGFAVSVMFGHFATQDTYGNYRYVLILAGLFSALSLSGLSIGVMQSAARGFGGVLSQGFKLNVRWSTGLVFLSLCAAAYYFFFQHNIFLALSCLIIGIFAPVLNSASLYDSYLEGKKEFKRQMIYDAFDAIVPAFFLAAALLLTKRAIVLIATYFLVNTLAALFFFMLSNRRAQNDRTDPELFHYSAHLSAMNIISTIADKIDSLVVFALLGPAQLAVYAFAIVIPEQIKTFVKSLTALSISGFSGRTITEIKSTIWHRIGILSLGLGGALLVYVLLAPWIFKLLFPVYIGAVTYSQIYTFSIIFSAINIPLSSVLQAKKKTRALYIFANGSSITLIVLLPILAYYFGIVGVIVSQFIYRGTGAGILLWQLSQTED